MRAASFQSTPHCESEANFDLSTAAFGDLLFQSTPHCESEANMFHAHIMVLARSFQSTPHCESEANNPSDAFDSRCDRFNPRLTARARRTQIQAIAAQRCEEFQSTPHCESEANTRSPSPCRFDLKFQSTPHCESEANVGVADVVALKKGFNPRLTARARRTGVEEYPHPDGRVSIHASLRERGELGLVSKLVSADLFQSTPHCESEANRSIRVRSRVSIAFQSTPHCESEANL